MKISLSEFKKLGLIDSSKRDSVHTGTGSKPNKKSVKTKGRRPIKKINPNLESVKEVQFEMPLVIVPRESVRVDPGKPAYTPKRAKKFMQNVSLETMRKFARIGPFTGPICVDITMVFEVPVSWPEWKKEQALAGFIVPTKRPDLDNVEKNLFDGMQDHAYLNDSQIVEKTVRKEYGLRPLIKIKIKGKSNVGCIEVSSKKGFVAKLEERKKFIRG